MGVETHRERLDSGRDCLRELDAGGMESLAPARPYAFLRHPAAVTDVLETPRSHPSVSNSSNSPCIKCRVIFLCASVSLLQC